MNTLPELAEGMYIYNWAASWQNQQSVCAPSEDSDQTGQSDQSLRCPHEKSLDP